jgi:uncharacterized protein YgbK (DUF1537 family)
MKPLLGCIGDDTTGSTDLANNLVRAGMRTVQTIGVPSHDLTDACDAVVVALKSRTNPAAEAVEQSLAALAWLRKQGVQQIYFKYCSTFDSTAAGNIGPVTEALMDALGAPFTIACPAFPVNQRTVFLGHLFVGNQLLSDSGMRNHPLTPMTDSNLVRVLQAQTKRKVGLVPYDVVARGPDAIRASFERLQADGVGIAILDAVSDEDLMRIGPALAGMPLVTAGSGVAIGLPQNWRAPSCPRRRERRRSSRAAARSPRRRRCWSSGGPGGPRTRSIRWPSRPVTTSPLPRSRNWCRVWPPARCSPTRRPTRRRCAPCRNGSAWNARVRWSSRRSRASPSGSWKPASGNWSWPAARPPVPQCRRWASSSS